MPPEREANVLISKDRAAEIEQFLKRFPPTARDFPALRASGAALVCLLADGALRHSDPVVRRNCIGYLDHLANADTARVLLQALSDPVPRVRRHAIHALTCEACKEVPLPVDVITPLLECVRNDANAKVRFEALRALVWRLPDDRRNVVLDEVEVRRDRELFEEALKARRRAVPSALRQRAETYLVTNVQPKPAVL